MICQAFTIADETCRVLILKNALYTTTTKFGTCTSRLTMVLWSILIFDTTYNYCTCMLELLFYPLFVCVSVQLFSQSVIEILHVIDEDVFFLVWRDFLFLLFTYTNQFERSRINYRLKLWNMIKMFVSFCYGYETVSHGKLKTYTLCLHSSGKAYCRLNGKYFRLSTRFIYIMTFGVRLSILQSVW